MGKSEKKEWEDTKWYTIQVRVKEILVENGLWVEKGEPWDKIGLQARAWGPMIESTSYLIGKEANDKEEALIILITKCKRKDEIVVRVFQETTKSALGTRICSLLKQGGMVVQSKLVVRKQEDEEELKENGKEKKKT